MSNSEAFFVTRIYRAPLSDLGQAPDTDEMEVSCYSIAEDDEAGQTWCEENGYTGYTSYASLDDLAWRFPIFADLSALLEKHAARFVEEMQLDLDGKELTLDSLWINILPTGALHTSHIHPHSVISGTTYVSMPKGTSAIKFEDPRSGRMMAAPLRKPDAPRDGQSFIYFEPEVGEVLLWESWLRHEVPMNMAEEERISVSFNFGWR